MSARDHAEIVARAEARAFADCARGLVDLEAVAATSAPWVISGDAGGRRLILPARDSALGMAAYLRDAIAAETARRASL